MTEFGSFDNSTCKRVLDLLKPGDLTLGRKTDKRHERQAKDCKRRQRHWLNKYRAITFLLNDNALICMRNYSN